MIFLLFVLFGAGNLLILVAKSSILAPKFFRA